MNMSKLIEANNNEPNDNNNEPNDNNEHNEPNQNRKAILAKCFF